MPKKRGTWKSTHGGHECGGSRIRTLEWPIAERQDRFDDKLLENLVRTFDSETLRTATGDLLGRISEYLLMKFAMQGAQDNGEFFFVQSSHFIERMGQDTKF